MTQVVVERTKPKLIVVVYTNYTFTIRLHYGGGYVDRILKIAVVTSINSSMAYDSTQLSSERQSRTWKDINLKEY